MSAFLSLSLMQYCIPAHRRCLLSCVLCTAMLHHCSNLTANSAVLSRVLTGPGCALCAHAATPVAQQDVCLPRPRRAPVVDVLPAVLPAGLLIGCGRTRGCHALELMGTALLYATCCLQYGNLLASDKLDRPDVVLLGSGRQVMQQPGDDQDILLTVCNGQPALKHRTCCLQASQGPAGKALHTVNSMQTALKKHVNCCLQGMQRMTGRT